MKNKRLVLGSLVCFERYDNDTFGIVIATGRCDEHHVGAGTGALAYSFSHSPDECARIMWLDGIIGHFPYNASEILIIRCRAPK